MYNYWKPRIFFCFLSLMLLFAVSLVAPSSEAMAQEPKLKIHKNQYTPDELLVKFRPGVTHLQAKAISKASGAIEVRAFKRPRRMKTSVIDSWRRIKLGKGVSLYKARTRLLKNPTVERVEYNFKVSIVLTPNDPGFSQLWGLHNTGQTGGTADADIDAPEAWSITTGSNTVVVAVIDTGVDYTHPDLADNMWTNPGEIPGNGIDDDGNGYIDDVYGYDFANNDGDPFDDHGHGTHVSGTISARGDNNIGVVGVSWQTRIMAVKFLSAGGGGTTADAISAVLYAADMGAKVMNNSWGGGGFSQALKDAIIVADQSGALFVAAAGNSNNNNDLNPHYPSSYDVPNVLAVAATDHNDAKASFSSYGATTVDLGAPGVSIYSTVPTSGSSCCSDPSGYKLLSGTSMATPHTSGAAALVMAHFSGISHHQVKDRLMNSVDPVSSMQGITVTGGRLNVANALDDDTTPPAAVTDLAPAGTTSGTVTLSWTATGDDGNIGTASSYDLRYSTSPIDATNFDQATPVEGVPIGGPAGTSESHKVTGLDYSTTYYFALKVKDNVGNASGISNVVSATTKAVKVVFSDNMESGGGNWTITGSDGVGGPALWHLSPHRVNSPTTAFYYGKEDTFDYNTGARNFGAITSVPINLSGQTGAQLSFYHFLETENLSPYDTARLQVSNDGGLTWTDIYVTASGTGGLMVKKTFDLSGYDGQTIQLRFGFDTVDSILNGFEGWVVDDVAVTVTSDAPPNNPPVANPGGPYTIQWNKPLTLDGSKSSDPDGDTLTYQWNFGDGSTGTGVKPIHTYTKSGAYTVTLIVNDGQVDSAAVTTTAMVNNNTPVANAGGPYSAVASTAIKFDGSGSTDADGDSLSYQWDFGDGTKATGVSPTHTYQKPGNYTVSLVVNDGDLSSKPATTTATIVGTIDNVSLVPEVSTIKVGSSQAMDLTAANTSGQTLKRVKVEYSYSAGLNVANLQASPAATKVQIDTNKRRIKLEWRDVAPGVILKASFDVNSNTVGDYTLTPRKVQYDLPVGGRKNGTGNTATVHVVP